MIYVSVHGSRISILASLGYPIIFFFFSEIHPATADRSYATNLVLLFWILTIISKSIRIMGIIDIAYNAKAAGSPCDFPTDDFILARVCNIAGEKFQIIFMLRRNTFLSTELKELAA